MIGYWSNRRHTKRRGWSYSLPISIPISLVTCSPCPNFFIHTLYQLGFTRISTHLNPYPQRFTMDHARRHAIKSWIKTWLGSFYALTLEKPLKTFSSEKCPINKKARKRWPAVIDNTWGIVTLSQTFRYCSFSKIVESKKRVLQHAKKEGSIWQCVSLPIPFS